MSEVSGSRQQHESRVKMKEPSAPPQPASVTDDELDDFAAMASELHNFGRVMSGTYGEYEDFVRRLGGGGTFHGRTCPHTACQACHPRHSK